MAHETLLDTEIGIIKTKLHGLIKAQELLEIMKEDVDLAKMYHCFFWLNDYTEAKYDFSIADIYNFPKEFSDIAEPLGRDKFLITRAIVNSKIDDNYRFAELVSQNRGQNVQVFETADNAIIWLMEKIKKIEV
jgi:hypothetical protein